LVQTLLVGCFNLCGVIITAVVTYNTVNKKVKDVLNKKLSKREFVNDTRNFCSAYFGLCLDYLYFLKLNIKTIKKTIFSCLQIIKIV